MKLPEPVAWMHQQGNHDEVSERPLLDDEKERGWTDEPLYSETQVKELLAQADKDFSDGMTVVHLQVADQMKKRYEPVLKQALEALWTTATPKCEDAIKAIQEVLA